LDLALLLITGFLPFTAIPTETGGGNHTAAFQQSARSPEAHKACLDVSKALAATGVRVLTDHDFFDKVRLLQLLAWLKSTDQSADVGAKIV